MVSDLVASASISCELITSDHWINQHCEHRAVTDPARRGISASHATVIAAICGLLGGVGGAFIKGYYDQASQITVEKTRVGGALDLERLKFQADLILKAIDTEEQAIAVKTLKFFANAGLIPNYRAEVLALAETDEGSAVPALRPSPSPYQPFTALEPSSNPVKLGNAVGLFMVDGRGRCTAFLVEGSRVIVPSFCLTGREDLEQLGFRLGYDSEDATFRDLRFQRVEKADAAGLAVLRVDAEAVAGLSALSLLMREPVPGEEVYMVHHPRAGPKQLSPDCHLDPEHPIAVATAVGMGGDERPMLHFACRSEGGSAGAPVIAVRDGAVLGIHVAGRVSGFEQYAIPTGEFVKASTALP